MKSAFGKFVLVAWLMFLGAGAAWSQEEAGEQTNGTEEALSGVTAQAKEDVSEAARGLMEGDVSALMPLIEKYLVPAVSALLFLIVGYFLAKLFSRMVSRPLMERVDPTVGRFAGKLVYYAILIFVILGVLGKFGISVASFAAVLAAAGFAVGLAFQGSLSNFASGVLLLVFRPYKVGDVVNAAGITAKVTEIDLFTTVFDTVDNRRIIVPNSEISAGTIENISHHPERRVDVAVGVDYGADIDTTRKTLSTACESLKEFLVEGEGRGHQVYLVDLGDSAVNWTVRFWTRAENYWEVKEQLTAAVKNHLDQASIGIPYPQMDIHMVSPS